MCAYVQNVFLSVSVTVCVRACVIVMCNNTKNIERRWQACNLNKDEQDTWKHARRRDPQFFDVICHSSAQMYGVCHIL